MSKWFYMNDNAGGESWPKSPNTPSATVIGYFGMDLGTPEAAGTLSYTFNSTDGDQAWMFTSPVGEPGVEWIDGQLNRTRVSINALGANCSIKRADFFAVNAAGDARASGTATWQGANQTWNTTGVKTWDNYWNPDVTDPDYRFALQLTLGNTSGTDQTVTIDTGSANSWFATAWQLGPWPEGIPSTNAFGDATVAHLQDTGWVSPGSATQESPGGPDTWFSPGSILASDNVDASVNMSESSESLWLVAYNFGLAVPSTALVVGVEVRYEAAGGGSGTYHVEMAPSLYTQGSGQNGNAKAQTAVTLTDTYYTRGGPADNWGATLTPAIVNASTFAAAVKAYYVDRQIGYVDHIQVKVYYIEGATTIAPSGLASTNAFGTATVTTGAVTVSPSGIASTAAFGAASVAPSSTISPAGIANAQAFGTPNLYEFVGVSPDGIANVNSFGTAELSGNTVPEGIASTVAFGDHAVYINATPAGIASTAEVGTPSVLLGAATIAPAGINSTLAFGDFTSALSDPTIYPPGIHNVNKFGIASLSGGRILTTEVQYVPSFPPFEPEKLGEWTMMELLKITETFAKGNQEISLELTVAAPPKVYDGLVRYADGVNWDPGAGEGFYGYYQNGWHKLG